MAFRLLGMNPGQYQEYPKCHSQDPPTNMLHRVSKVIILTHVCLTKKVHHTILHE